VYNPDADQEHKDIEYPTDRNITDMLCDYRKHRHPG
jgi:hypothetical protein